MSELSFVIVDSALKASVQRDKDSVLVKIGGKEFRIEAIGDNLYQLTTNGNSFSVAVIKHRDIIYVDIEGTVIEVQDSTAIQNQSQASHHNQIKDKVFAPMPGKIVKIMVKKGDVVQARQPLAIVEAMKMENSIASPSEGKVKAVNFAVGDQVNTTSPIIELELAHGQ